MKPISIIQKLNERDESWRTKVGEASLKSPSNNPEWIIGKVKYGPKFYDVQAKVYMEPSNNGINGGPTSKLVIKDNKGNILCSYERGWETEPTDKKVFEEILKYVEDYRNRHPYETED